jgi:photosystem II stability/assembly factor-like uncharacterized protein
VNKGVRADFLPEKYPEVGRCVHKFVLNPANPSALYQQNHCGMHISKNGEDIWEEAPEGLLSTFGFSVIVSPRHPDTVFLAPLIGDYNRVYPKGGMVVYRSVDGGKTWEACRNGLPQASYVNILREGLAADTLDPTGVYVGCQDGSIFVSRDDGNTWYQLLRYLPPVLSVSCVVV